MAGKDLRFTSGVTAVNVADFHSRPGAIYGIKVTLFSGPIELCALPFRVNISGFGGTTAYAVTGVSALAGAGALASASMAANGLNAKLDTKVQVARRRPRGWRRRVPVTDWKRSIISTLPGAVTGMGLAVLMQQSGISPLSLGNAVWGLILGGGISFGVGYSLGVVKTLLQSPVKE